MVEYIEIPYYTGYRVGDDDGSVWSNNRWRRDSKNQESGLWYRLKFSVDRCGYNRVKLYRGEEYRQVFAHILVLENFIGPCPPGMVAAHEDGNPQNNNLENLRWDTQQGNLEDRLKHGTLMQGTKNHRSKLNEDLVRDIRRRHWYGETYAEIARDLGMNDSTISKAINYVSWTHVD